MLLNKRQFINYGIHVNYFRVDITVDTERILIDIKLFGVMFKLGDILNRS